MQFFIEGHNKKADPFRLFHARTCLKTFSIFSEIIGSIGIIQEHA